MTMNPSITVESSLGNFRARCTYSDDAAEMTITVTQKMPGDGYATYRPVGTITLTDAPYHALRDRVHGLVARIEEEFI